jgi:hypothetical protein
MEDVHGLDAFKRIGTGISFIVFPLVFVYAFSHHPDLLQGRILGPEELILRVRGNASLHLGHALVTLNTGLLIVAALHFMKLLRGSSAPWAGFVGGVLAVAGSLMLAADKGALCLSMSALESLSPSEFSGMMPGLLAMFSKQGWLVLLWGLLLVPIGFLVQAAALFTSKAIPRWQSALFLVSMVFIGFPDGVEIINLSASILMAIALVPYGIQLMLKRTHSADGNSHAV